MEIIMEQTISLMCKTQGEYMRLIEDGYELKEVGEVKYLVREVV